MTKFDWDGFNRTLMGLNINPAISESIVTAVKVGLLGPQGFYRVPGITEDHGGTSYRGLLFGPAGDARTPYLFCQVDHQRFVLIDRGGNRWDDPMPWKEFKKEFPTLTYIGKPTAWTL